MDWKRLSQRLLRLDRDRQRLAAAFLCEVGYRDFERFCELSGWPHRAGFRQLLDLLWEALRNQGARATVPFNRSIFPDVDRFNEWEATLACNAGIELEAACSTPTPLRTCLEITDDSTDQVAYALEVGEKAYDILGELVLPAVTLLEDTENHTVIDQLRQLPSSRWTNS